MNPQMIVARIEQWLHSQAETEIQEVLVDLMMDSMKEPLLSSFPPGFNLDDVPVFMQEQFLNQIKAQVLISLKSLINANKENGRINDLIVNKYFSAEERTQSLASVDKYSKSYTEEVEGFYHRINGGNFQNIMFN